MISEEGIHQSKEMCFIILGQLLYIGYTLYNIFFQELVCIAGQVIQYRQGF